MIITGLIMTHGGDRSVRTSADYNLLASGKLKESEEIFGFSTHPAGHGPMEEYTGFVLSNNLTKLLLPRGLAFSERLPYQDEIHDLLMTHGGNWSLFFDFVERNPLVVVSVGTQDIDRSLLIGMVTSADGIPVWMTRYGGETDPLYHYFEIQEWVVPDLFDDKIISVVDKEAHFGTKYC